MSTQLTASDKGLQDDETSLRWLAGLWVLVALFALLTVFRSHQIGIPLRDPDGSFFLGRAITSAVLFAVFVLADTAYRARRRGSSLRGWSGVFRERWTGKRLGLAVSGLLAYHAVYFCYHNLKSWDAFSAVHDGVLSRVDHWLFFGHSPAVLLHHLLGEQVAPYVLMVIYESFSYLVSVSFVAALVFVDRIRDGYVFIASAMWVWILGVGSYYLIPSIGPFNSSPQDFAQLPRTPVTDTQARYLLQREHLLHHPGAGDAFAQLSAFASLHVAFTCLILLMARYYGLRRAARVMMVYLAGVLIATIYLGWHFVVDDVAGLAIAVLAAWLGRLMVHPRQRSVPSVVLRIRRVGRSPT